jgi:hypothetical protein
MAAINGFNNFFHELSSPRAVLYDPLIQKDHHTQGATPVSMKPLVNGKNGKSEVFYILLRHVYI